MVSRIAHSTTYTSKQLPFTARNQTGLKVLQDLYMQLKKTIRLMNLLIIAPEIILSPSFF